MNQQSWRTYNKNNFEIANDNATLEYIGMSKNNYEHSTVFEHNRISL